MPRAYLTMQERISSKDQQCDDKITKEILFNRKKQSIKFRQIEEETGLRYRYIHSLMENISKASLADLRKIFRALNIEPEDIVHLLYQKVD